MKSFRELILELFEKPYGFRLVRSTDTKSLYETETDSGKLQVSFFYDAFDKSEGHIWDIAFAVNNSTELTNKGEPTRILATVVAVVDDFIEARKNSGEEPDGFTYETKNAEPGRAKVYARMVQRFGAEHGYTVEKRQSKSGNNTIYNIRKAK